MFHKTNIFSFPPIFLTSSIVGSVVECSPATRAARVRFPDDANIFCQLISRATTGGIEITYTSKALLANKIKLLINRAFTYN